MKKTEKKPFFYAQVKFDNFTESWLYKENTPKKMVQSFTTQEEALSFMEWREKNHNEEFRATKIINEIKEEIDSLKERYNILAKRNCKQNKKQYGWYLGKIDVLEDLMDFINGKEL